MQTPGTSFFQFSAFFITASLLTACGGGGASSDTSRGQGEPSTFPQTSPAVDCNEVFTEEKVAAFNQSQKAFYVKTSGYDVHCTSESRVNSSTVRTEVTGKSNLVILPQIRMSAFEKDSQAESYTLKVTAVAATDAEVKAVLAAMNINVGEKNPSLYIDSSQSMPSYLRFARGDLFAMELNRPNGAGNENRINFILKGEDAETSAALKLKMVEYAANPRGIELFWSPRAGTLARAEISNEQPSWSGVSAAQVITSLVKDTVKTNQSLVYREAIETASLWDVSGSELNATLPELYAFVSNDWKTPVIADNTAFQLLLELRYLLQIDPRSELKNTQLAYDQISRFGGTTASSLKIAYDYASKKSYSSAQFDFLIEISGVLYSEFNNHSWELAQAIAAHAQYDRETCLFIAKIAKLMRASSLLDYSTPDLSAVFTKIASGLNAANADLYFSSLQYFKNHFRAGNPEAEQACDSLVLTQKLTAQNQSLYFDFFTWLSNTAYADFSRSIEVVKGLTKTAALQTATVSGFESVYKWLVNRAYQDRETALIKTTALLADPIYSEQSMSSLQAYFDWLVNSAYLSRSDALAKAENSFFVQHATSVQLETIQDLMSWYTNTVYLNRSDALTRAETLVWVKKITSDQLTLLKDMVSFLINSVYLNRSDSASKAEAYLNLGNSFNAQRAESLKSLFTWYTNTIYQNRSDALASAEKIVISSQFDQILVEVMKNSAQWLMNSLNLNRSEAATKAQGYYQQNRMTGTQLSQLQSEYNTQKSHGLSSADALKYAEAKVLRVQ